MKYIFALLLALVTTTANGQVRGVAYYAIQKFTKAQCEQALQVFDGVRLPSLSILWGTFGENTSCIRSFLDRFSKVPHILEINITNETCRRAPRYCGLGEIARDLRFWHLNEKLEAHDPTIRAKYAARIRQIKAFIKEATNENTTVFLTTGLEDNFTSKAYRQVVRILKRNAPHFPIVRSTIGPKAYLADSYRANYVELHGFGADVSTTKSCIFSNDGHDIDFNSGRRPLDGSRSVSELLSEIRRVKRDCSIVFVWWNSQGVVDGKFVEPRRRNIRLYSKDVSIVNQILKGEIQ